MLELIQNAEDNHFTRAINLGRDPAISFEVNHAKIFVECNEDGFTEANVNSICRTGRSSKRYQRGYIGEKGIGFKSVFQVASKVHIQSNSFSFSFEYDGEANTNKLGIITPVVEDEVIALEDRPLTRMTLTLLQSLPHNYLVTQFQSIPDDLLLFLSTLKKLEIKIRHTDQRIQVTTFKKSENLTTNMTSLMKTVEDPNEQETRNSFENQYYTTKRQVSGLPVDDARLDVDECEVVLAFPLESSRPLISAQNVFAFLPVRDFGFSV